MIDPALADARRRLLALLDGRVDDLAATQVHPLVRRITSISERELRRLKLTRLINGGCVRLGYRVLAWLWRSRTDDDPLAREMLLDLLTTRPLTESLGYERVRKLYAMVRLEGPEEMGRLFLSPPIPRRPLGVRDRQEENEKMVSVSLGLRKAQARGRDRFKLDRLRFDRNPAVIRNMLRNSRVVEGDVIRIAAQRPTNPECIVEIYRSTRWISRYSIKKAVAFNPYTPIDISIAVMPHLVRQDLVDLSRAKTADEQVRLAAVELLRGRPGGAAARRRRTPSSEEGGTDEGENGRKEPEG